MVCVYIGTGREKCSSHKVLNTIIKENETVSKFDTFAEEKCFSSVKVSVKNRCQSG